jgi:hypothetical protein
MEIERYDTLLTNGTITNLDALMVYVSNSGMIYNQLFTCVAYIVTGIGVLMTPTIADTIVTAGGAGAMTKMKWCSTNKRRCQNHHTCCQNGGASVAGAAVKSAAAGSPSGMVGSAMNNSKNKNMLIKNIEQRIKSTKLFPSERWLLLSLSCWRVSFSPTR